MSPCTENSFKFKNSETFRNSVLIFTYNIINGNGMFQGNSNDLFIVLLITKYNIIQDIDNRIQTLDENLIFILCFALIVIGEGILIKETAFIKS
ncbi:hypothetical protein T11_15248 [Trichinella zimbabwensis]|uniref:Uncharacterized protein n=1 Tax=Trichinella zimbabwensis TaxID=268475 RepID=A0A0V1GX27_9BILA|nr:hypothetical protein T11_15248 [Trichinella zimbabwensis]